MRNPACILITGASGAIGGALAREYAAPGVTQDPAAPRLSQQ